MYTFTVADGFKFGLGLAAAAFAVELAKPVVWSYADTYVRKFQKNEDD